MSIEFEKIKLIDSHNFIPMPLSKFPKTFGFTNFNIFSTGIRRLAFFHWRFQFQRRIVQVLFE